MGIFMCILLWILMRIWIGIWMGILMGIFIEFYWDFCWDDGNFDGNLDGNLIGIFDDGFNGIQWLSLVYPGVWHWLLLPCFLLKQRNKEKLRCGSDFFLMKEEQTRLKLNLWVFKKNNNIVTLFSLQIWVIIKCEWHSNLSDTPVWVTF